MPMDVLYEIHSSEICYLQDLPIQLSAVTVQSVLVAFIVREGDERDAFEAPRVREAQHLAG